MQDVGRQSQMTRADVPAVLPAQLEGINCGHLGERHQDPTAEGFIFPSEKMSTGDFHGQRMAAVFTAEAGEGRP